MAHGKAEGEGGVRLVGFAGRRPVALCTQDYVCWVSGVLSSRVVILSGTRRRSRYRYHSVSERVEIFTATCFPRFVTFGGLARFGEQHDVPGLLGPSPSPVGHLLRRDDTRVGSQGESTQGATGPDILQSGTKGGVLLGRGRRGISSVEVTRRLRLDVFVVARYFVRRACRVLPVFCSSCTSSVPVERIPT